MKRVVYLITIMMFAGATLQAQEEIQEDQIIEGPALTFEQETIDYGTIEQNADGNREFVFTNTGTEPLIIERCQGTCGCTVPKCQKEPVLPGESGSIKVKYATNRLGKFNKGVKVYSNATPSGTPITVYIKGNVLTSEQFANQAVEQTEPEEEGQEQ